MLVMTMTAVSEYVDIQSSDNRPLESQMEP